MPPVHKLCIKIYIPPAFHTILYYIEHFVTLLVCVFSSEDD